MAKPKKRDFFHFFTQTMLSPIVVRSEQGRRAAPVTTKKTHLRLLDSGAYGDVYLLGKKRVIKIPRRDDEATRQQTKREMAIADIVHPNIVRCFGVHPKFGGLIFEHAGVDLFNVLVKHTNGLANDDPDMYARTLLQLFCGLAHLHSYAIQHLDIKLENLMMREGVLKIADFGMASRVPPTSRMDIAMCAGSPAYVPEPFIAYRPDFFHRRDAWACGCVVFAMTYGCMLYHSWDSVGYRHLVGKDHINGLGCIYGKTPHPVAEALMHYLFFHTQPCFAFFLHSGAPGSCCATA